METGTAKTQTGALPDVALIGGTAEFLIHLIP
jgi:hypothetical protein